MASTLRATVVFARSNAFLICYDFQVPSVATNEDTMKLLITTRYFRYFDWINFGLTIAILALGLLFVFSATYNPEYPCSMFFKKQCFGAATGLIIYFIFCSVDLPSITRYGYLSYFGVLGLLAYTMVSGAMVMGARRWISLYFIRMQPAELCKLFLPAFIGYAIFKESTTATRTKFFMPLGILLLSFVLILKQPDLGTALIILFAGFFLLWFAGLSSRFFMILGLASLLGSPLLWYGLKPYQQNRILVLLGYGDQNKEGYQTHQSKIAVGSGGVWGRGLLQGTQNKLGFIPEDHSDFIFSVLAEEWGFWGNLLVIVLFCLLFGRILLVTISITDHLYRTIALGLALHIMLSLCINIGMVIGLMPIVGIPLPLFTYGVSNLWVCLASLGWLNNIAIRRFYY